MRNWAAKRISQFPPLVIPLHPKIRIDVNERLTCSARQHGKFLRTALPAGSLATGAAVVLASTVRRGCEAGRTGPAPGDGQAGGASFLGTIRERQAGTHRAVLFAQARLLLLAGGHEETPHLRATARKTHCQFRLSFWRARAGSLARGTGRKQRIRAGQAGLRVYPERSANVIPTRPTKTHWLRMGDSHDHHSSSGPSAESAPRLQPASGGCPEAAGACGQPGHGGPLS